jgi:hypothetical protein
MKQIPWAISRLVHGWLSPLLLSTGLQKLGWRVLSAVSPSHRLRWSIRGFRLLPPEGQFTMIGEVESFIEATREGLKVYHLYPDPYLDSSFTATPEVTELILASLGSARDVRVRIAALIEAHPCIVSEQTYRAVLSTFLAEDNGLAEFLRPAVRYFMESTEAQSSGPLTPSHCEVTAQWTLDLALPLVDDRQPDRVIRALWAATSVRSVFGGEVYRRCLTHAGYEWDPVESALLRGIPEYEEYPVTPSVVTRATPPPRTSRPRRRPDRERRS